MDRVVIESSQCKGCGLCVETCPRDCIYIGSELNSIGYLYARFESETCNACALCFYVCPEPGAVTVIRDRGSREVSSAGERNKEVAG